MAPISLRPGQFTDLEALVALQIADDVADYGAPQGRSVAAEHARWQALDPQHDTWVAATSTQERIGYAFLAPQLRDSGAIAWYQAYVLPAARTADLYQALLGPAEARFQTWAPGGVRRVLRAVATNPVAAQTYAAAGYRAGPAFQTMQICLTDAPRPRAPAGITLQPFVPEQDNQAAYTADEEASTDKGYARPLTYAEWVARLGIYGPPDPAFWFLAREAGAVVGGVYSEIDAARMVGVIHHIGVRRRWRHRGIGRALLLQAFAALWAREVRTIILDVDAASPTGAPRVYAQAGMHTIGTRSLYLKEWAGPG